jgi:hypothetical protein
MALTVGGLAAGGIAQFKTFDHEAGGVRGFVTSAGIHTAAPGQPGRGPR